VTPPPQWYVPLPAGVARAPKVTRLRAEFGTLGITTFVVLLAEGETQKQLRKGTDRGLVRMTYIELGYLVADSPENVRPVLERMVELGELIDAEFGEFEFSVRWKDWDRWQEPLADPKLSEAKDFLRRELAGGPKRAAEINAKAEIEGIAGRTLDRARRDLGVAASGGPGSKLSLMENSANSAS
jgi:hypothetical protein